MTHRLLIVVLLALSSACTTTRVVRLDTGQGEPLVHRPREDEAGPVEMEEDEFTQSLAEQARKVRPSIPPEQAARELFGVPERSGWYGFNPRQGLVSQSEQPPASVMAQPDVELTHDYLRWCERKGTPGDCLKLLVNSPIRRRESG